MIYFQNGPTGVRTPKHRLVWQGGLGYFNIVPSGNIGKPSDAATHGDDPVIVVGNGTNATHRADAFTVSYDGHSTVFDQLGMGGRIPTLGSTYNDNIIYAWGDVPAGPAPGIGVIVNPTAGFGIFQIIHPANGEYDITLELDDPSGSHTLIGASITVTVEDAATGSACEFATSTAIGVGGANTFKVHLHDTSCGSPNNAFMFKVCGR